jgi:hypothetical protein
MMVECFPPGKSGVDGSVGTYFVSLTGTYTDRFGCSISTPTRSGQLILIAMGVGALHGVDWHVL